MADQIPESTKSDMSWIDIAVLGQKRGVVIVDYAPGWSDFLDELHFADAIDGEEPDHLASGAYRWTGFTIGFWDEGDRAVVTGGTFTRSAPPAMDREAVKWRERWHGSEPEKGSAIVDYRGNMIAYLGGDEATHAAVTQVVAAHNAILSNLSADAIRQGEGNCGPNGVASVQVETIATAVMRWGAPHFKHMVAFSTLCEAIGHSVDTTFADTNGGLRQALDALRAERAKPVQGPEHGAWDRGRRYGLDDAMRIVASLEGCPATPASHASDGGKA